MKKREIEKKLMIAADNFVPNIADNLVNTTAQYSANENVALLARGNVNKKKIVVIAVAILFVFICGMAIASGLYLNSDDSYVYIDINPSVQLTINKAGYVKKVVARNDDAEEFLKGNNLKGLSLEKAVDSVITLAVEKKFIDDKSEKNEISLSVFNKNKTKAEKQMENVNNNAKKLFEGKGINCKIDGAIGDKKENDSALEQGISPIKLKLIKLIMAQDSTLSLDELKNCNVRQLRELLEKLTQESKKPSLWDKGILFK